MPEIEFPEFPGRIPAHERHALSPAHLGQMTGPVPTGHPVKVEHVVPYFH